MINTRKIKFKKVLERSIQIFIIVFTLGVSIFPIVWLIMTSIRPIVEITSSELMLFPQKFTLSNYETVFEYYHFSDYVLNSIIISVSVVITNIIIGAPAGYVLARYSFTGEGIIFIIIIFMRMVPMVAVVVPMFIIFSNLGLLDTKASLIIAHTAFKLPVTIWLLRGFFADIPRELEDSARVDGCSTIGALVRIAMPLVKPGIAASSVLAFMYTWNDFIVTLVLSNTLESEMIALGLSKFLQEFGVAWGPLTAAGTLMFIPTLLFVFVAERYLVRGLTLGAIKG